MNQIKNQRNIFFFFLLIGVGIPVLGVVALLVSRYSTFRSQVSLDNTVPGTMMGYAGNSVAGTAQPADVYRTTSAIASTKQAAGFESTIAPMPPIQDSGFVAGENRVVVKTANLALVVDDVRQTVEQISNLMKTEKGVVTNSNIFETGPKGAVQAQLTLRVPVAQLDDSLAQLRKLAAKVTQDNLNADDRTKQKVDMEARLNNLKATEQQLLSIMKQAKSVQDTLTVQRELTNVRSQIEILTAEVQNLGSDAEMSTIQVSLSSRESDLPAVSAQQNSIWEEIKISLRDMVRLYRQLFILGLRTFILLLPIMVIGLIAWFAWKRKARKS